MLIGIGAAVIGQAQWLLLLSLGIGFVEILESSTLIAVWKWGGGRAAFSLTPNRDPEGTPPSSRERGA